jgi:hypothetical protein
MPKKFGPAGDCRHLKVGTLKVNHLVFVKENFDFWGAKFVLKCTLG